MMRVSAGARPEPSTRAVVVGSVVSAIGVPPYDQARGTTRPNVVAIQRSYCSGAQSVTPTSSR